MSQDLPPANAVKQGPPTRRRLWLWFAVIFAVIFLVVLLALALWPMAFYDGRAVRHTMLGHYYLLEIQRELNSSGNLGPTSGHAAAALQTAVIHFAVATIAAAIVTGIGWVSQRRS